MPPVPAPARSCATRYLGGLLRRRPSAATARPIRTEWWWAPSPTIFRTIPAGYHSFEQVVVVEVDPQRAPFAWAHEFGFVAGGGGRLALETDGGGADGKFAVFSVTGAPGSHGTASSAGDGRSCSLPWPWEERRAYRMRVWTDSEGWWSAEVGEKDGAPPALIGRLQVPSGWRRLGSRSLSSSEYTGPALARCDQLPVAQVALSLPTADGGAMTPLRHESSLGPGTCDGSTVEDVTGGWVRHRMGGLP